jgi:hypothetical protein
MARLILLAALALAGCGERGMTYDQLDATRANALNALNRANSAYSMAEELLASSSDHEGRIRSGVPY